MRSKFKRMTTALLAVLMLITTMMPTSAFAAEITMDLSKAEVSQEYTLTDAEGNVFTAHYGLKAEDNPYGYEIRTYEKKMHDYIAKSPTAPADKADWVYGQDYVYCFCIEHGIPLPDSENYSGSPELTHGNKYEMLSENQKDLLSLALAYGYTNRTDLETSKDANACYSATQLIIWQITFGFRTSPTELNDKTYPADGYTGTMTEQYTSNPYLKDYYDRILSDMATHYTRPSFTSNVPAAARTYEMEYANGRYSVTLTDTNNVLSKYRVTVNGGASAYISGNTLTVSSTQPLTDAITIKLNRRMPSTTHTTGFLIWSVPGNEDGNQDMISGVPANNDPVPSYFKVSTAAGSMKIIKISEDENVDGVRFNITGNGVNETVITQNGGQIQIDNLRPGTYTVTEITEDQYEEQAPKTVTVVSGATSTVTFVNSLKRGDLKIIKTSEDGNVSGIPFTVTGNGISMTVVTNAYGEVTIDGLMPGTYTVTELTENFYEPQEARTVTVNYDQTATVSFSNVLKRGDLRIIKTSEDGIVEGLAFRLYGTSLSGQWVDEYAYTNADGVAVFDNILIAGYQGYTIEEIGTPNRYVIPDMQTAEIEWNVVIEKAFENSLKRGDLKVTKTSEDSLVEGVTFHLYGVSLSGIMVDEYAVTDKNGIAYFNDILIGSGYILEEVDTAERYIVPDQQTAAIEWNEVTEKSFANVLKRGDLKIIKTAEDNLVEGLEFHLYGTSLSGIKVDEYATTDANGVAYFEDILIGSGYTIEEVNTPIRYVVPEAQDAVIEWNQVTEQSFENILKKWRADVFKLDDEIADSTAEEKSALPMMFSLTSDSMVEELGSPYGETQGDATLESAVYGVYRNGVLLDTYTTDANGYFITDYYSCTLNGEQAEFYIQEISPSEGYLLDTTKYYIDCSAENYTVELNTEYPDVYETAIKGNISIIKHTDDGSTQIETPEAGAKFEIYLKSAGSYETAKETERDIIICDEYGFGQTKMLPYGVYTVHQISGWEGRELMDDFDVFISQDGQTYRYLINNRNFESYLRVVKIDSTTGKTIPYAGAGFQIFDPFGNLVTMTYTYPEVTEISTFYTTADGTLLTPEKLEFGTGYSLVEVEAPYGYVLDTTPIYFDVTEENSADENGITVIKVEKPNSPQMGTITIEKTGEAFSSVVYEENIYRPIYEVTGLADATYGVYAVEDVYTPDGTLRYSAGEKVATLITGSDGTATSEPLFLGKFKIVEEKAPYGTVLNTDPIYAELTYAGENIKITATTVSAVNERQKVIISLLKEMEQDDTFGIGLGDEYSNVKFGLYMADTITAADGTVIPKDGLLEIVSIDENGLGVFTVDVPVGAKLFVKEYATDEHYLLSDAIYPIEFAYQGETVATVQIVINDGNAIDNIIIRGNIEGLKIDEDNNPVGNVLFGLFKSDETIFSVETALMIAESDTDGKFSFIGVPYGNWVLKELSCPEQFVLSDELINVTVSEQDQVVSFSVVNEFLTGDVEGLKVDDDNVPVSGAVFGLFADGTTEFTEETAIALSETDENGLFGFTNLRYGKWIIKELFCPEQYVMSEEPIEVVISKHKQVLKVTAENKWVIGKVQGLKTDEDGNSVAGVTFGLFADGTTEFTEETSIAFSITDENGLFEFSNLRYGKWIIKELSCPEQFVMSDELIEVIISEQDQLINITAENKFITGDVKGLKVDDNNAPVSGAVFGLFADGTTEFTEETALALSETSENGIFGFSELRYGKWLIKELTCPEKYVMSDEVFEVDISEDGVVISITAINKIVTGTVRVHKISSTDHDEKLTEAEFEIYLDVNGNEAFEPDVDTLYGKLEEIESGIYEMSGLEHNGYFLFESKAPEGFQKDDRYFYFSIKTNGETVVIENEIDVGFVNEPIPTPDNPDSPQTGDTTNLTLWICLAAGSLGLAVLLIVIDRKKKQKQ